MADLEFKKCPFCGSENPTLDVSIVFDEYFGILCCRHCGGGFTRRYDMSASFEFTKDNLMKLWNRRSGEEVASDAE